MKKRYCFLQGLGGSLVLLLFFSLYSNSQEYIPFHSDQWQIYNGEIVEHLGRQSLTGTAFLKDVNFQNGVIEVDIAVDGTRSYPGINFRIQSPQNYEKFYMRPHRSGLYPDAMQYSPVTNGITEWQLWVGEGYTSGAEIPENEWIHFKIEVNGTRAKIYQNNEEKPFLDIYDLKHGLSSGTIGLNGPSAFFSNFSYNETDDLDLGVPPIIHYPTGIIKDWEISQPFKITKVDFEKTPQQQELKEIEWQDVNADQTGLVNIGQFYGMQGREPVCVFAKTYIYADDDKVKEFRFGYSDAVSIFLNGEIIYFGNSAYQKRDPSFLGIIGLNDAVFLQLKTGKNELIFLVAESFGGWGFKVQDAKFIEKGDEITEIWETERDFKVSESVLYDPKREVLYVSNFDQFNQGDPNIKQHLSKLNMKGEVMELNWSGELTNPLGMTWYKDRIYSAERKAIAIIDPETGEVTDRIEVSESVFLNDIAIDKKGDIYVSDSRKNVIWKCTDQRCEEWLAGPEVLDPNVMYMYEDKLLFGNSGDQWLKSVDLDSKTVSPIAKLGSGFIDGIRPDGEGNLLVSLWEGRLYRVSMDGVVTKILDTTAPGYYIADFEYIPETGIIYIPTFYDNRVVSYKLK